MQVVIQVEGRYDRRVLVHESNHTLDTQNKFRIRIDFTRINRLSFRLQLRHTKPKLCVLNIRI